MKGMVVNPLLGMIVEATEQEVSEGCAAGP